MFQLEVQCDESLVVDADWLKKCAAQAYSGDSEQGSAVLRIVGRDEAQTLNRDYREKDYATNILSFPSDFGDLPEGVLDEEEAGYLGDLVVCTEVVYDEAQQQQKTLSDHWAHLVIHGVLHLQGYDHIEEQEAQIMESLEIKLLSELGVPDPYNETPKG
ncbi:rRNA maturation RNase YbeY [Leucothrix arctica]|uniref:Endoribonuclease YbeY n=1 Tax=Leucothrix arctica TaxID=1481894 RepID=A0A317CI72_9GAMM|nr:rRNA maturation RNase YbeY [Leucothrix arctica]PWQ98268.1 rRNA maturation RNase YbeY [Leucothrix arctica]